MARVLITGGAGFVGSHLSGSLLKIGHEVVVVDNFATGSLENLKESQKEKNFKFIEADIIKGVPDMEPCDYIFHLASPASPADFSKIPEEIALTNSVGAINVLELARETGAKVLMASTSEVYGDPLEHPQKETYWGNVNSFGPRACYDESKRFAETMSYIYLTKHDLDISLVRIFNTYGPRMRPDDGRAISNFVNQAIKEEPITIYGDGKQTRSFCYVSDMVQGIGRAMFSERTKGEVFNLGNPDEYSMLELVEKIKEITNSNSEVVFKESPKDDPKRRRPDITKAKNVLEWKPEVGLEEGLRKTASFYRNLN